MASHASAETHPREWAVFAQLDRNGDGALSSSEFYDALENMGYAQAANKLLAEMDLNSDGVVTFDEFVVGFAKFMGTGQASNKEEVKLFPGLSKGTSVKLRLMGAEDADVEEARADFNSIDEDGSGQITVDEMRKMLLECSLGGVPPTEEEVAKMFAEYDVNDDKAITFEEYIIRLYNIQEMRHEAAPAAPAAPPTEPDASPTTGDTADAPPPPEGTEELPPADVKQFAGLSPATCASLHQAGATEEEVEEARADFNSIDADGSGQITKDEMKQMLLECSMGGEPPSEEEVAKLFAEYDVDGDKAITFEEYVVKLYNLKQSRQQ